MTLNLSTQAKVLLINPPVHTNKYKPRRACFPLGLGYIASVLRENGVDVKVLDCVAEGINMVYPVDLTNTGKTNVVVNGLRPDEIKNRIQSAAPDIVGIGCSAYTMQQPAKAVARVAKEAGAKWVVLGGPHASGLPEYFLELPDIDFIIIGEGEFSFLELVKKIQKGMAHPARDIDGIAYRKNSKVEINPKTQYIEDVDTLPYPAWNLFPLEKYFEIDVPSSMVSCTGRSLEFMTSRGCPHGCKFCASTVYNGPYRPRTPSSVVSEMEVLKNDYGVKELHIVDDQLTLDRNRLIELCKLMVEEQLDIKWGVPNAIGPYGLDDEVVSWLARSGFYYTHLALESGNKKVLQEIMNKPTELEEGIAAVDLLFRYDIDVSLVFLVGTPGETFEDMADTFRYAANLPAYEAFFYFATPLPGTPLYRLCRDRGYIPEDFLERIYDFQEPIITTPEWTPAQVKRFVRKGVIKLHLKYFVRRPLGMLYRYVRRYGKSLKIIKSFFLFLARD